MTQHVNFLGKYIFEDIKTENSLIYKKIRFTNLKEIFEMKKFGDSNKFGIQYSFLENPFNEKGVFGESWGEFKLFINGSDICEYLEEKESKTYTWNLYFIIEWLCENLEFILGYDDFPLPVKGENILELVDAANNFEIEDELEEYLWHSAKSSWTFRHTWFSSRGGSVLALAYFCRKNNDIEISWDSGLWIKNEIKFTNLIGTFLVEKEEFRKIVLEFLYDILSSLKITTEDDIKQVREWTQKINLLN